MRQRLSFKKRFGHFAISIGLMLLAQASGAEVRHRVVGELRDATTGARWILLRDAAHPAGPGQLVPADSIAAARLPPVVIHAGERVVVEEHTGKRDIRMEGTAMGSAAAGDSIKIRLRIGGRVMTGVAVESGRVRLDLEGRP